jgi:hypothetical protein
MNNSKSTESTSKQPCDKHVVKNNIILHISFDTYDLRKMLILQVT